MIKKGVPKEERGPCTVDHGFISSRGTMAYVLQFPSCTVNSERDCGMKDVQGRYVVNVCEYFWDSLSTSSSRVATLVHEVSHHFGADDHAYCDGNDCFELSSAQAHDNADTYKALVEKLVVDRRLQ